LGPIIHFRSENKDSIFHQKAINWAVKNNNSLMMMMELLKLEHHSHKTPKEGLQCLKNTISESPEEIQSWFLKMYTKFSTSLACKVILGEFNPNPHCLGI
jgi:hypothetical protein